jgi:hypothetical protein
MDRILKVFCGEQVPCIEEWAKNRKVPQKLVTRIYHSLTDPRNAYEHVEEIFDLFEKEKDEPIKNKIRMALVRIQMFSQYHMFEQSEFRDAGEMASLLERMLFEYNLTEGRKPKKDETSSDEE